MSKLEQLTADLAWRNAGELRPTTGAYWRGAMVRTSVRGASGWVRVTIAIDDACAVTLTKLSPAGAEVWTVELDGNVPVAVISAALTAALAA